MLVPVAGADHAALGEPVPGLTKGKCRHPRCDLRQDLGVILDSCLSHMTRDHLVGTPDLFHLLHEFGIPPLLPPPHDRLVAGLCDVSLDHAGSPSQVLPPRVSLYSIRSP